MLTFRQARKAARHAQLRGEMRVGAHEHEPAMHIGPAKRRRNAAERQISPKGKAVKSVVINVKYDKKTGKTRVLVG